MTFTRYDTDSCVVLWAYKDPHQPLYWCFTPGNTRVLPSWPTPKCVTDTKISKLIYQHLENGSFELKVHAKDGVGHDEIDPYFQSHFRDWEIVNGHLEACTNDKKLIGRTLEYLHQTFLIHYCIVQKVLRNINHPINTRAIIADSILKSPYFTMANADTTEKVLLRGPVHQFLIRRIGAFEFVFQEKICKTSIKTTQLLVAERSIEFEGCQFFTATDLVAYIRSTRGLKPPIDDPSLKFLPDWP